MNKLRLLQITLGITLLITSSMMISNSYHEQTKTMIVNFDNFQSVVPDWFAEHGMTIKIQYTLIPSIVVDIPVSMVSAVENLPGVNSVQKNFVYNTLAIPNDPGYSQLWGMDKISAPAAWDVRTDASSVTVAVVDTGVQITHPDLAGNIWTNTGEIANNGIDDDGNGYVDDVHGWDFLNNDNSVYDSTSDDHGTHVSGTIGAVGNNGVGVAGVAWNVNIMPLKFIGTTGGSTADAISAIQYATSMGANIISASWGGGGFDQALKNAIDAFPGLFVAAAGNNGVDNDASPHYPSSYTSTNLVSVASTTSTDGMSSFSNWGATSVDIGAPGSNIYSTWPSNTYNTISGTSMATPHVSGAAALVLASDPTLTPQQLKARLLDFADPVSSLAGKTVSGGRLNVYASLTGGTPPPADTTAPTVSIVSPTGTVSGTVTVEATITDNVGVTSADYRIDAGTWTALSGVGNSWTASLDTTTIVNGTHTVDFRGSDAAANTGTASGSFTVANAAGTPPSGPVTDTFTGSVSSTTRDQIYYFDVGSAGDISASLSWAGSTDLDFYLYAPGASPTGTGYVARAYTLSNPETLTYAASQTGTWAIRVNFYSGSTVSFTLDVTHPAGSSTPPAAPVTDTFTGSVSSTTTDQIYYFSVGSAGDITASLSWTGSTDLDFYLYAPGASPTGTGYVARAYTLANPESLTYAASQTGTWAIRVNFYSGSAVSFSLSVTHPAPLVAIASTDSVSQMHASANQFSTVAVSVPMDKISKY